MYTIREASARSGVGVPLLRAWERRYAVVAPQRTTTGYRLYDDEAIDRLRAMRRLIERGWSAQQAAERVRSTPAADLAELTGDAGAAAPWAAPASEAQPDSTVSARLVDAAREIDAAAIEAALDEAYGSARFEVATDRVVMPALRSIGEAWERGEVDVAGEHAASHAVLRRFAMAFEAAGEGRTARPVLVGLGPGSYHELGAFAFAIAARRDGLPVLYLGPNLPAASWVTAAETSGARAAVVGVPSRGDVRHARSVIRALERARPAIVLAAGGDEAQRAVAGTNAMALPATSISGAVSSLRSALVPRRG
jgi:DNA-binding transcriptional MerR regulator/methylmalonyl-CoA mutase cobalamin-binding subunit